MVGAAKKVVFDAEASGGSNIEDKTAGERLPLRKQGNLWTLNARVKEAPTPRQWINQSKDARQPFGRQECVVTLPTL